MSCAHPLEIVPRIRYQGDYLYYPHSVRVPCGYCVNCRVDKQNYIIDRATYEYCQRLTGAFVTFTYDDIYLIEHCAVTDERGIVFDDINGDKVPRTSLNYKDLTDFINSIQHYIKRHKELHSILCQPDFSYLYCGEYGDCFGRCHFHVLFFGLDFAFCKKLIFERWKYGFIDVLPILDGGIQYVTKYMDKFEKGVLAEIKYDFKGLARPRLRMSNNFGQGLLWNNVDEIIKNDYCYSARHNRLRPISQYWKLLLTGNVTSRDVTKKNWYTKNDRYLQKVKNVVATDLKNYLPARHNIDLYDEKIQSEFKLRLARIREKNIEISLHNKSIPVAPFSSVIKSRYGFVTYDHKKLKRLNVRIKRELVNEYFDYLYSQVPNYFISKEVS